MIRSGGQWWQKVWGKIIKEEETIWNEIPLPLYPMGDWGRGQIFLSFTIAIVPKWMHCQLPLTVYWHWNTIQWLFTPFWFTILLQWAAVFALCDPFWGLINGAIHTQFQHHIANKFQQIILHHLPAYILQYYWCNAQCNSCVICFLLLMILQCDCLLFRIAPPARLALEDSFLCVPRNGRNAFKDEASGGRCHVSSRVLFAVTVGMQHKAAPRSSRIRLSMTDKQMILFHCPELPWLPVWGMRPLGYDAAVRGRMTHGHAWQTYCYWRCPQDSSWDP